MTPAKPSQPIEITPRQAPLAHSQVNRGVGSSLPARTMAIALAAVLGLGLLVWVFLFLPANVGEPSVTVIDPRSGQTSSQLPQANSGETALPPFAEVQREQARERAQTSLSRFVDLQLQLEAMNVEQWGADAFAQARRLATDGDEQFLRDNFGAALGAYSEGADALATLKATGERLLSAAISSGTSALDARNLEAAVDAFEEAAIYAADAPDVVAGQRRTEALPKVIELERKARRFEQRGQPRKALETWQQAAALDPALAGAGARVEPLQRQLAQATFNGHLSRGFTALDAGRYDDARSAFNAAANMRPNDPAVIGARQQLSEATVLSDLDRLRLQATRAMADESFADAAQLYAEALAIDPTLAFARDGEDGAKRLATNSARIAGLLDDPLVLSDDRTLKEADALASTTLSQDSDHDGLAKQAARLAALIEDYRNPVTLTLTSDAATAITIYRVGELGSFASRQIELRPGRYTIVGVRNGCRDVRTEVVVLPGMEPIDIRCQEPI